MIAHVAEASERSGRVVLWLDPELRCTPALLDAPVRLAAAYEAEIETIVVDQAPDEDFDLPVRRIGRAATADILEPSVTERRFELLAQRCRRAVESASAARKVKVRHALAHGDAVDRISEMCLARGPWNIVALVRMPALGGHSVIGSLLANVGGATGFLLCSERPVDANVSENARVVVIVEDGDRLPSMLRAAERLSAPDGAIHIVIGAETVDEHAELEGQARLLASDSSTIVFEEAGPTFGVPGALTEIVARMKPNFVVARFGGSALADGRELARASAATRAPILLVR
jgi:hypothetical protein